MAGGATCKHCGAILPLPDTAGRASCFSCGRTTKSRVAPPAPPYGEPGSGSIGSAPSYGDPGSGSAGSDLPPDNPFSTWTPGPGQSRPTVGAPKRSGCAMFGCLTGVIVAVVGILGSVIVFRSVSSDVGSTIDEAFEDVRPSSLYPSGSVVHALAGTEGVVVDGGGSGPVDVATAVYQPSDDTRFLARLRLGVDGDDAVQWRTDPFPPDVYAAALALTGDRLFAGVDDEVWALSASSGAVAWEATLPDVVRAGCTECFVLSGDTLLVLTADAQILAYGPGSAEPRWTRRLESTAGRFVVAGAGIAVIDHPPGQPGEMQVFVVDPATGATVSAHRPQCSDGSGPIIRTFSFTDQVYPVPGGTDLIATVSFGGGCAVRWNGATGQVVWAATVGDGTSIDRAPGLLADDRLFLTSSTGPVAVDVTTGQWTQWTSPPDLTARPLARHGPVLVTASASTRGSTRTGLMGWDVGTGQVRWQAPLPEGSELITAGAGSSEALFSGSPRSVLVSEGNQLELATFDGDSRTVSVQTIVPATGDLGAPVVSQLGSRSGTPSVRVHEAHPSSLLVSLDSRIVFVGPGGRVVQWPA